MEKYNLVPEQLKYEGIISDDNLFQPNPASDDQVLAVHDPTYFQKLLTGKLSRAEERATGFKWSEELIEREITIMGGTIESVSYAAEYGISANIAGGTHHAFADRGEGFCLLNDLAMAARHAQNLGFAKILILDLDVHHGNGTASIFQGDPSVFTFSMHGAKNYPFRKPQGDLDIALEDKTDDAFYLKVLEENLKIVLTEFQPDFVLYQSGVDVLEEDKLGRLGLSLQGCQRRDEIAFDLIRNADIPISFALGGGYSPKISTIVDAHANTFRLAAEYVD